MVLEERGNTLAGFKRQIVPGDVERAQQRSVSAEPVEELRQACSHDTAVRHIEDRQLTRAYSIPAEQTSKNGTVRHGDGKISHLQLSKVQVTVLRRRTIHCVKKLCQTAFPAAARTDVNRMEL